MDWYFNLIDFGNETDKVIQSGIGRFKHKYTITLRMVDIAENVGLNHVVFLHFHDLRYGHNQMLLAFVLYFHTPSIQRNGGSKIVVTDYQSHTMCKDSMAKYGNLMIGS